MSWYLAIPFVFLILAFVIRMPIGFGMLIGSIAYFLAKGMSLGSMVNAMCYGLTNSYILIAIPLFVFTANVMNSSQVTDKIFDFARAIIGRKHGATGYVNILASLIFAGMTGSALADASGLGILEIDADEEGRVRHALLLRDHGRLGGHRAHLPPVHPVRHLRHDLRCLGGQALPRRHGARVHPLHRHGHLRVLHLQEAQLPGRRQGRPSSSSSSARPRRYRRC